jgi:hypothetical protein
MAGSDSGDIPRFTVANTLSGAADSVFQVGTVNGDVMIHRDPAEVPEVPHQVPAPPDGFVRRAEIMSALEGTLGEGAHDSARIVVLSGLPGVGKSATARRWAADAAASRYPGGELYVDYASLRTSEGSSVSDALADCLRALGVRQEHIPARLSARANLFRTKTADRPVLVVLDDVTEPAQVRPLVPNSAGSAVIATSNARLTELSLDGAQLVTLSPMDTASGIALLRALYGSVRIDEEPVAAARLVELGGGLPVALRVAAAKLAARPHLSIAALVDDLADENRRLSRLSVRGRQWVTAVFNNAYESLPDDVAHLYRRLGAVPGRTISVDVAALAGRITRAAGDRLLEVLVEAHLLEDTPGGRFRFHDLIRLHAREKTAEHDAASPLAAQREQGLRPVPVTSLCGR